MSVKSAEGGGKFLCSCYFQRNIFLHKYNLHITYNNNQDGEHVFWEQYGGVLAERGCRDVTQRNQVVEKITKEIHRRRTQGKQSAERRELIKNTYKPLHTDIYELKTSHLHPQFTKIVEYAKELTATVEGLMKLISPCEGERVFSFPVFTDEFCVKFMEEIDNFNRSEMPKGRPNTMNTSGILLRELGFYEHFMDPLRTDYVAPIARLLYPEWCGTGGLDSQRAFIVSYDCERDGDDTDLNIHFDNAEVTLNVSLDDNFQGGDLYLGGMRKNPSSKYTRILHQRHHGILHRGHHMHGALPLEEGRRHNLIVWMRSSCVRNQLCPMCDNAPVLVPTEGEGDGFSKENLDGGGVGTICQVT